MEKTALTGVYLKMLHRKLLNDVDIGSEKYNDLYAKEKKRLQQKVLEAYNQASPEEKSLHRKEIQKQVIKGTQQEQQQEFYFILNHLQKKRDGMPFYYNILNTAKGQGLQTSPTPPSGLLYAEAYWEH